MRIKGQLRAFAMVGMTAVSVLALGVASASAQLDNATGIADPGRAGQQLQRPDLAPRVEPEIKVKDAAPQNVPAGADKISLTFRGFQFDGVTVYSDAELQSVYADKIGQTLSLADVYGIANQIMLKYRNDGYILTQVVVPPQTIGDGGTPRLVVVEGYVEKITLQKEDEAARIDMKNIEAYASGISRGTALNTRDLERQLLIINDLPGITARSVLSPSPTTPGAADILIIVKYDPVDALVSLDNYGSRYLGPTQLGAAGTFNSPFGVNDALSAQISAAPQGRELAYGSLGYERPVGTYGTKMHITASATDTEPGYDLKEFDVRGRAYRVNVGMTHPFIRSRAQNLFARLNFDWLRVKSWNNIEDTRRDRISALRLGGRYEFMDRLVGTAANTLDVQISKGLNILGASDEGDSNMTRSLADPQFTKLEASVERLQRITGGVNLLLSGRGQLASNALLSSEEFSVGGINSGRGYDPSEITGDEGVSGRAELQWKEPIKPTFTFMDSYQLYGFYDIGRVWNTDATTNSQKRDSLAAVGGGIRFDLKYDLNADLAVAFPLTRPVQTQSGNDHERDTKFYFSLTKKF